MLVVSPVVPQYLFGENFSASFEVEENLSSETATFSGYVEYGTFKLGDYVYVMNRYYKILACGRISSLVSYERDLACANEDTFIFNFGIDAELCETDELLYVVKLDRALSKDVFILVTHTEEDVLIDYACDLKTAICKYLNKSLKDDDNLEDVWTGLNQVEVQALLRKLKTEGKDTIFYPDRQIELIYLPGKL